MKTSALVLAVLATAVPAFATLPAIGDACPRGNDSKVSEDKCGSQCDDTCLISEVFVAENGAEFSVDCECKDDNSGSDSSDSNDSNAYAAPKKGEECNVKTLTQNGYTVTEACCEGDDKSLCPDYKQCRIEAANLTKKEIKCACVAGPEVNDKCDNDLLFPKTKECSDDCKECRVQKVTGEGKASTVECACVDCGDKKCDVYAYDNTEYCRDTKPKPCADKSGFEVSVCGDATYKVQTDDITKVCSGHGDKPSGGDLCPKKGDLATAACRAEVWSFNFGPKGKCQAPEDAQCLKLKTTGAWGCVFPTNCNEKRGCLTENVCNDKYVKHNETGLCQTTKNGYPIQANTTSADYIDTKNATKPSATVNYKSAGEGFATITNVLSLIVGMFTTALTIFASA